MNVRSLSCLNYESCKSLLAGVSRKRLARETVLSRGATLCSPNQDHFVVTLHGNPIIHLFPDGSMVLSSCGWLTRTTCRRLQALAGVLVYKRDGKWYIEARGGSQTLPFVDGIRIRSDGSIDTAYGT